MPFDCARSLSMIYCAENESLFQPWMDHGFSRCFVATVTVFTLSLLLLPFGVVSIVFYMRHGTEILSSFYHCRQKFSKLQPLFMILLVLEAAIHFVLHIVLIEPRIIRGYALLELLFSLVCWPLACVLWKYETRFAVPRVSQRQHHGILLLLFWTAALLCNTLPLVSINSPNWWWQLVTSSNKCEFFLWLFRYGLCTSLFMLGLWAPGLPNLFTSSTLVEVNSTVPHGSSACTASRSTRPLCPSIEKAWLKMKLMYPYVWPKNSFTLQLRVLMGVLLLVAGRVVNIFVPLFYKRIVDSLTIENGKKNATFDARWTGERLADMSPGLIYRWDYILIYVGLRFLQGIVGGGSGFLGNLRTFIWIRVDQYTMREISVRLFSHLHGLSLRWHLSKKTGEVLRVMDRGTSSINTILNYVIFEIMPTIFDIAIGVVYFATFFNLWFGLIVLITMILYLVCTIFITEWLAKFRRRANLLDNERNGRAVDSLLNFETVKYYGADRFEVDRYSKAIVDYNSADYISQVSFCILSLTQNGIINVGFLSGALLCAWYVVRNSHEPLSSSAFTVGDYVLFASYILQLYGPLNSFGTYYRMIQKQFVDMENMFDLLNQIQDIKDVENAPSICVTRGEVEFRDVHFHYDPARPVLRGFSFFVPEGTTCALVGQSGGGKSTVVRLLFRLYDIQHGQILIDRQNIAAVTQESLRKTIGVVPQDTVLFNDTILYNIRYGRVTASDAEVEAAADAADIHQRILSFPEGYATIVGERGLKLSGGEKQRVAIARTLLKSPRIVLLDEATSALDTQTERTIQTSLESVCRGRTTLVIAHRLSTIVGADQILVLHEGNLVERGTHIQLLEHGGRYAKMWQQQQSQNDVGDASENVNLTNS